MTAPVSTAAPRSRSTTVAVLLFMLVVLALSALLVRAREGRSASAAAPVISSPGSVPVLALEPLLRRQQLPGTLTVALVRDPASASYYDTPAVYDTMLAHWRRALVAAGASVRDVTPAALASDRSSVIVVAAAPCLSPETRAAMAQPAGRGIIFSWLTGTRDHDCRTVGFGLLAGLLGAGHADTVPASTREFLTVPVGGPLAIGVPPGARIELSPFTNVAVRHASRDAHYSDRDLNPITGAGAPLTDGALVHAASGTHRTVYFGFEMQAVVDRPWERGVAGLLVRNAVAWAAGLPLAAPDAWPGGHVAAAVLAQDVEHEFANARATLDTLRAAGAPPATFFVVSDIARAHLPLLRDLARYGEIGSHSESHIPLAGVTVERQQARLIGTQRDLTTLLGRPVGGLRPPEEKFDRQTMEAWQAAGGWYLFGTTDGRSASPELFTIGTQRMVLLGRVANDDFFIVRRARVLDPAKIAAEQLDAVRKVRALGGLYILSYHSNMLARPVTIAALGQVARALRADSTIWLTTTGEVARWWLQRDQLVAATDVIDSGASVRVTVHNESSAATPPVIVLVSLPLSRLPRAVADGAPLLPARPGTARVQFPALAPGATHTLTIELAEEAADAR